LIFLVESAWKVFTDVYIPSSRTYLFVHFCGTKTRGRFFTSDGLHAEQKFMKDFKGTYKERYRAGNKQVKLDVYLTHPINCAGQLKAFAEEYSFHLNIVVGACSELEEELHELIKEKEEELRELMKNEKKELSELMKNGEEQHKLKKKTELGELVKKENKLRKLVEKNNELRESMQKHENKLVEVSSKDRDVARKLKGDELPKLKGNELRKLINENEEELRKLLKNEEELCDLMTSGNCTLRSFRQQDYGDLARYLRFPIIPKATIDGDGKTEQMLRQTQYSE